MEFADYSRILVDLHPGDRVRVQWHKTQPGAKECYPKEGVVVQVTRRLVAIRSPGGFTFCVGVHDLACGTTITIIRKGVQVA